MDKLVKIGQGRNWDVYRMPNVDYTGFVAIRMPKKDPQHSIQAFIQNYEIIKRTKLVTLEEVTKVHICGYSAIQCEELNYLKDRVYVSPNSLCSDSRREKHQILQKISNALLDVTFFDDEGNPDAEKFRYENKIDEITNLRSFLDEVVVQLGHVSNENIEIDYDSYFIGSERNLQKVSLDYKIADLDNIFLHSQCDQIELYENNLNEFFTALQRFIEYFVNKDNQEDHLSILDQFSDSVLRKLT